MTVADLAKGGTATLFVDGTQVGEGRVDATVPMAFSADETCDVGSDTATPVTDDLREGETEFNGRIRWVELGDRRRCRGRRPPDFSGGALPARDGAPIAREG